jgi:hypothetical protein
MSDRSMGKTVSSVRGNLMWSSKCRRRAKGRYCRSLQHGSRGLSRPPVLRSPWLALALKEAVGSLAAPHLHVENDKAVA